ncbi:MAG: hypothetical protein QGH11_12015, partial [Pirellulaceae bacterium]|jgi:hypothetical protein|nr:hypothetical protein [Pirellulaceae bacterium]
LYKDPENSLKTKLLLESLQSGSVKFELYGEENTSLQNGTFSVADLMEDESIAVRVKINVKASIIVSLHLVP